MFRRELDKVNLMATNLLSMLYLCHHCCYTLYECTVKY